MNTASAATAPIVSQSASTADMISDDALRELSGLYVPPRPPPAVEKDRERQLRIERGRIRKEELRTGICHDHGECLNLCPSCSPLS